MLTILYGFFKYIYIRLTLAAPNLKPLERKYYLNNTQKQINNWFINQRKRHWKPSEDMQFMVMDGLHPQSATLYMDGHYMADGHYRLGP